MSNHDTSADQPGPRADLANSNSREDQQPRRQIITLRAEYRDAFDRLIDQVERTLRIFDADAATLDLNSAERVERLQTFLHRHPNNRLLVAIHDPGHLERSAPRFLKLIAFHASQIETRQTQGEASRAQDCFVLADDDRVVRRAAQSHPRGAVIEFDTAELQPMLQRFEEIWELSVPCLAPTTLGL